MPDAWPRAVQDQRPERRQATAAAERRRASASGAPLWRIAGPSGYSPGSKTRCPAPNATSTSGAPPWTIARPGS
ncbi:hypothetical protein [Nonomuraea sp. NPDC049028]|uniref:hypothetical protein n=1 Tax=Nonomuraea sp. NPDC049028 TaxID=3364348 RepID=UPI003713A36E